MKKVYKDAELPVFEIVCSEDANDPTGIRLLSIVADPAIEMKALMFSEDDIKDYAFKIDSEKQLLVGPMMIANKKILRKDDDGNKYFVVFKPETIELMVNKFMMGDNNHSINVDHSNTMVQAYIQQLWIVEDPYMDKAKKLGFTLPVGSAMVQVKILDKAFWNSEVKENGKFGFSIEGLMGEQPIKMSSVVTDKDMYDLLIDELLNDDEIRKYFDNKIKNK
jgi:hypothetical protein